MPAKGTHLSEEAKARISAANKGRQTTLGFHHSEDTKAKMSAERKGRTKPEDFKLKISQANKGKVRNEEARKHISEGKKGKKHKPHKKGNMWEWDISQERRAEISEIFKGRTFTDESRLKMVQNHHNPYRVIIDGQEYSSMKEAARALDIPYGRFTWLCRHPDIMQEKFGHMLDYIDE